jgi:NAD(P)-dependent dehydrogenase (short-subunit alcohol dehydrogenase family)
LSTIALTGVSNGIGKALARLLKQRGHKVIGLDISTPDFDLDHFISVDLSDPSSIQFAIEAVEDDLDGVCNSAGLPPRAGLEASILAVNFLGTRALTRGLEERLKDGASVVNMASRAGQGWREAADQVRRLGAVELGRDVIDFVAREQIDPVRAYNLSKEAVILWTMANAETYAQRGQRINSISPGAVETGILEDFASAFGDGMARNVARAGRPATPAEIAQLAAFLLSPESSWIKGSDIPIDGGMSAFATSEALDLSGLR